MREEVFTEHSDVELTALARAVGRRVARKWPGSDPEDLAQEGLLRLYEKADMLAGKDTKYFYRVMERAAMSYASKQRYMELVETSQYVYTPGEVRAMLEGPYFDAEAWDVPQQKDDPARDWIEAGTEGVSLMDMRTAFDRLSHSDQQVLNTRYFTNGGKVGDETEQKAVQRAVDRLTIRMNWGKSQESSEGFEGRRSISNETAQNITSSYTDGGDYPVYNEYEEDALAKLQKEYVDMGLRPGEGFDWNKYSREE